LRLEPLLRAHDFMRVERPPELWDADAEDITLVPLLGEMIVSRLALGARLEELILNASNVVVAADDPAPERGQGPTPGEYVALTLLGEGSREPEGIWNPQRGGTSARLRYLAEPLAAAGARFACTRSFDGKGTITVFLARKA
jgi:hypothetical protein